MNADFKNGLKVYALGGRYNLAQGNALGFDEPPMIYTKNGTELYLCFVLLFVDSSVQEISDDENNNQQ